MSQVVFCTNGTDLCRKVAGEFVSLANDYARSSGQFNVCLAGGNTPRGLYALLAAEPLKSQVPWKSCHFFWGDERCVPPDHAESNYRMARESLLAVVPIQESQIHRMKGEQEPTSAALDYELKLRQHFNLKAGEFPRFDLVLLGLGEDGHTASLFPDQEAVEVQDRMVVASYVSALETWRLSLTIPVFNQTQNVFFLVSGSSKAEAITRVFAPATSAKALPAQRINPKEGRLVWFIDREAARNLRLSAGMEP